MNERTWWSTHVKPRWHQPGAGRVAWKVEDAYQSGHPDVDCCFEGTVVKIELKYKESWPAREGTALTFSTLDKERKRPSIVSANQWNRLDQWRQAGGHALVLIGVGRSWYLFEHPEYIQEGMTRQAMRDLAIMQQDDEKATYATLAEIPAFIMETYGRK